jgi:hypothetical protein
LKLFGDSSYRTKQISRNAIAVLTSAIVAVLSIAWIVFGSFRYNTLVARSSSPVGTTMKFTRSNASVKISDIYTDTSKSALVIRLSPEEDAQTKLPFKGSDYRVYLTSKSLDGYKEADIIFGKMSTDGDMFLVIPRPTDDVYNVFIMNTKYLAVGLREKDNQKKSQQTGGANSIEDLTSSNLDDVGLRKSISKAISNYRYNPEGQEARQLVVDDNHSDVISFRVTTNPALKHDDKYKPIVLETQLLNDSNEFNFKSFFDIVFKQSVVNTLEKQFEANKSKILQIDEALQNARERIESNPLDSDAINSAKKLEEDLEEMQLEQEQLSSKHSQYSSLEYSDSLFTNLQTKARIVDTTWKKGD